MHLCLTGLLLLWNSIRSALSQGLTDPIYQYPKGSVGVRTVWWCPSGYGYLAFCPQPHDPDSYNWCCTRPYMGTHEPTCCPFPITVGAMVGAFIGIAVLLAVLLGLSCWCCPFCLLHKRLYEEQPEDQRKKPVDTVVRHRQESARLHRRRTVYHVDVDR